MQLAKNGQIGNVCGANALLTLTEYAQDYGDEEFREAAENLVEAKIPQIPNDRIREKAAEYVERIRAGERDFRF